jgi:hypothetical protein
MKSVSVATALAAGLAFACGGIAVPAHAADVTIHTTYAYGCGYAVGVYRMDYLYAHYPWCVTPAAAAHVYGYVWRYPSYAAYYPHAYYPYAAPGVVYGPAGAAAWGPYGGFAATTGTIANDVGGVTRASAGYNPWTGNAAAGRTATAYDASTGTRAVGQRGGAANVYTGNYGYGERRAAYNERTGAAAAGGHVTLGNAATGNEVQAGRGVAYNPSTGQTARVGGVHGENGGIARVNDQVFVGHNGNVQQVGAGRPKGKRPRGGLRK